MRLAFWRTEKPVARPVLQPGGDSPYAPRLGVWMEAGWATTTESDAKLKCHTCGVKDGNFIVYWVKGLTTSHLGSAHCEGCGAKLVAQLRREREG